MFFERNVVDIETVATCCCGRGISKSNDRKLIHLILVMRDYHDETTPLPKHDTAFYRQSHVSSYVIEREIEEKEGAWPVAYTPRLLVTTSFRRNNSSWPSPVDFVSPRGATSGPCPCFFS